MPLRSGLPSPAHARAHRRLALLVFASLALPRAEPAAAGPSGPSLRFERVAQDAPGDQTTALASNGEGLLAIGGTRGVRCVGDAGHPETWLRRGPVADLAFLGGAELLVATGDALYRVGRDGQALREHLAPGSEVPIRRLAVARGTAVAATDSGVYVREGGARWRPVRRLPQRPASLVALRERPESLELWSVIEGELWIAQLRGGDSVVVDAAVRTPLPTAHRSDPADDLHFDLPFAEAVLVFPDSLAVRDAAGAWRTLRPPLPPGARASRLAFAHGRLWLASAAGLLSAARLEGPWERAEAPLGTTPVAALVGDGRAIFIAARGRVLRSTPAPRAATRLHPYVSIRSPGPEPEIAEVQRVVLDYVGLDPERLRAMQRGAATRGWLPELHVSGGYERARGRHHDYDQAFVGGDMRELFDRDRDDDHDFDIGATLSWDFGDTRFHPEEIDVLRETRAVIALRDDILDEVTQLYFERRRVLAEISQLPESGPEQAALLARAAELAAGLDAWTGGWFSRRTARSVSMVPPPHQ